MISRAKHKNQNAKNNLKELDTFYNDSNFD